MIHNFVERGVNSIVHLEHINLLFVNEHFTDKADAKRALLYKFFVIFAVWMI